MSKKISEQSRGRMRKAFRNGLAATGFITAIIVVLIICFVFKVNLQTMAVGLAILLVLVAGVPLAIHAIREDRDTKDIHETCQPILKAYEKHKSPEKLIKDYYDWCEGEHGTYARVHFGGDVVYELQGAKKYEEALRILDEIGQIDMKARERYDYENYRDAVKPQLMEGIEKEKKRAEERSRNKNLKK